MNFQEMNAKATVFQELQVIVQNKPQLIRTKQESIRKMELQIAELENNQTQQAYSLLNPKRYMNKYDCVAIQKEIDHLKQAVTAEQNALEELITLLPIEVVDVQMIQQEVQEIINQQQPALDRLATKVLQAQMNYFDLLQEYSDQYHQVGRFQRSISSFVIGKEEEKIRRDYGPRSERIIEIEVPRTRAGQPIGVPYKVEPVAPNFKLTGLYVDSRIIKGHKERITNVYGELSEELR